MSDDKIISATLPHPEVQGPPLALGTSYAHHFLVDLISDGRRLWAKASEEGQRVMTYMQLRGKEADHTEYHAMIEEMEQRRKTRAAEEAEARADGPWSGARGEGVANQSHQQDQGLGQQSNPGGQGVGQQQTNPNNRQQQGAQSQALDPDGKPASGGDPGEQSGNAGLDPDAAALAKISGA